MRLFHPATVLACALLLVVLLQVVLAAEFDREARARSPLGTAAGFPLDDAWIHQVYARSIAERGLPEYNPGEPETGQSSLLWGVLLAPVHALATTAGVPVARAARVFGLLVWIGLALAAAFLVQTLPIPAARFGAFMAALLIALDPALAFAAASGMEPLLLALLAVLAFAFLFRGRPLAAGVMAGLAVLARPEGILVAGVIAAAAAAHRARPGSQALPSRLGALLRVAVPVLIAAAAWCALCLWITGRPLPNTFYAKAAPPTGFGTGAEGLALLAGTFGRSPFYVSYVGYLFPVIGAVALLSRCGTARALAFLATPVLFCIGVAATRAMPEPAAFYWERYLTPIIPLQDVCAAVGFAGAGAVLMDLMRKPRARDDGAESTAAEDDDEPPPAAEATSDADARPLILPHPPRSAQPLPIPDVVLAVALLLVAVIPLAAAPQGLRERIAEFGANVHDVDVMNVEAALWIRDTLALPPGATVAAQDAGAVRYFVEQPVLDLLGLNDHTLVDLFLDATAPGGVLAYLERRDPRAFFLLEPDPGAVEFRIFAATHGLGKVREFGVDAYSLFGPSIPRAVVVLADTPP